MYETVGRGRATMWHKDLGPVQGVRTYSLHCHHANPRKERATDFGREPVRSCTDRSEPRSGHGCGALTLFFARTHGSLVTTLALSFARLSH